MSKTPSGEWRVRESKTSPGKWENLQYQDCLLIICKLSPFLPLTLIHRGLSEVPRSAFDLKQWEIIRSEKWQRHQIPINLTADSFWNLESMGASPGTSLSTSCVISQKLLAFLNCGSCIGKWKWCSHYEINVRSTWGFTSGSVVKNPQANTGDSCSFPELGRSLGEGNSNPLQYSCLENPKDREAWRATVHGVITKSGTGLSN